MSSQDIEHLLPREAGHGFGPVQWFDESLVHREYGTNLPHYKIPGAIYFVTFRLWDSIPADVYASLLDARNRFLDGNPFPHTDDQRCEYKRIFIAPAERYLDQGLGECVLRDARTRQILMDILTRFDGARYQLGDYVVMPNHVHLLVRVRRDLRLRSTCRQWTNLSAARINEALGRSGRLWQTDPFDHIVRDRRNCTSSESTSSVTRGTCRWQTTRLVSAACSVSPGRK